MKNFEAMGSPRGLKAPREKPLPGSVPIDTFVDRLGESRTVYKLKNWYDPKIQKRVPVLDSEGEEVWRLHPTTGQKQNQVFQLEDVYRDLIYYLDWSPRGHEFIHEYFPASEEELNRRKVMARKEAILDELALEMAERDIGVGELLDGMGLGGKDPKKDPNDEPVAVKAGDEFPLQSGENSWILSDETEIEGTEEEALKAQIALTEEVEGF